MLPVVIYRFNHPSGTVSDQGRGDIVAASSALPTAQIVIEILEQLIKHTDPEHGLTAAEISKRINVSDKTVRGISRHCSP